MKFRLLMLLLMAAHVLPAQKAQEDSIAMALAMKRRFGPREYTLPDPKPYAETIRPEDLKKLLDVLASAEMGGRETGEEGQRKAAAFISNQFKAEGLPTVGDRNTFQQMVNLQNQSWKNLALVVEKQEFKNKTDFYVYPAANPDQPLLEISEIVFVGYGIEDAKYNDYAKADVEGKAVVFYDGEPVDANGKSLLTGTEGRTFWTADWRKKVQLAKKKGAVMAFIVDPNMEENMKANRKLLSTYGWRAMTNDSAEVAQKYINSMFITPALASTLFGKKAGKMEEALADIRQSGKSKPVKAKSDITVRLDKESKQLIGSNVIGFIEGSDPELKKEYVFITAHYDHLGMSDSTRIFYGADDNASGTSGVIEIARAFAEARKKGAGPKRSVVCMLVSGEEKGLLGSRFYVDAPLYPLNQTVTDINIDMIGRVDDAHAGNPDYVYVIGSDRLSRELHKLVEWNNHHYTKLALDYKYNDKNDPNHYYERSDHYNFAEKGIPVVFFFNGTHADYHKVTDTPDKINFEALAKRAQLAFYIAWDVANRPNRLIVDKQE